MNNLNAKIKNNSDPDIVDIHSAIESASESINHLHKIIKESSILIASARYDEAFKCMDKIYSMLDLLMKLLRQIITSQSDLFKGNATAQKNLNQIEVHLLGVMKALVVAKEKKDYIMVADLLEYELIDNLTQWKIKILLEISKFLNQSLKIET